MNRRAKVRKLLPLLAIAIGCSSAAGDASKADAAKQKAAGHRIGRSRSDAAWGAAQALNLEEAPVAELQSRMTSGSLSARTLVEAYLARIRELDPMLKSVLELNPDALAIADALDAERKTKGPRGPLHGIPVLIKDNIATADGMQTTAGSLALIGVKPPRDSFVARRLREAGAVILGKTNLSEWANIRGAHSSSGWSARGGQTHNPYVLDRTPCGSSSGTGAAIAASLAAVGVGTETNGSIICPASKQALVGIKPTVGLVSRSGIIPISHTQDTAGPMARTVADAAALLTALAGFDPADAATGPLHSQPAVDYTKSLDPNGLKGARIGIVRAGVMGQTRAVDKIADETVAMLKAAGAVIVDPADIPNNGKYEGQLDLLLYELKADLEAYLKEWAPGAPVKSLQDLIAFNDKHAAEELPWFGQELFEAAAKKGSLDAEEYKKAAATLRRQSRAEGLDKVFAEHKLDALVAPSGGPAWFIDHVTGDHSVASSSSPSAISGYPAITVPAGFERGLPMGITFMGPAYSEAALIRLAYAYEQLTHARKAPHYLPTVEEK